LIACFRLQAKADGKTPEYYTRSGNAEGAAVLRHYEETLKSCDALDYSDFISCVVKLLQTDPEGGSCGSTLGFETASLSGGWKS
jgi:superfamily I DNA/RNA helicase